MAETVTLRLSDRQAYKYAHKLSDIAETIKDDDEAYFLLTEIVLLLLEAQNISAEKFFTLRQQFSGRT